MAAVTIQVPDEIAEAFAPLDTLNGGHSSLSYLLREELYRLAWDLQGIPEAASDELPADDLRRIARRLDAVAEAVEAIR